MGVEARGDVAGLINDEGGAMGAAFRRMDGAGPSWLVALEWSGKKGPPDMREVWRVRRCVERF